MCDEDVPPFTVRPGEDFDDAYARARKKLQMLTEGMPKLLQDALRQKLDLYGQDSATSSHNGTPCKEWIGKRLNGYGLVSIAY